MLTESVRGFKERVHAAKEWVNPFNEKRRRTRREIHEEHKVFREHFPTPVSYSGVLSNGQPLDPFMRGLNLGGEFDDIATKYNNDPDLLTNQEKRLVREAGLKALGGTYVTETASEGYVLIAQIESSDDNCDNITAFLRYQEGPNFRYPASSGVVLDGASLVFTFPTFPQAAKPLAILLHTQPEDQARQTAKFERYNLRLV
jgi:hypothetical protein